MVVHNSFKSLFGRRTTTALDNVNTPSQRIPHIAQQENAIDEAQLPAQLRALVEKDRNTERWRTH